MGVEIKKIINQKRKSIIFETARDISVVFSTHGQLIQDHIFNTQIIFSFNCGAHTATDFFIFSLF